MTIRATGDYATIGGHEYQVVAHGSDREGRREIGILLDGADESGFDDVVDHPNGRMATVPRDDADQLDRVHTTGTVDGAEVTLYGTGDIVPCSFSGDPDWAAAHGFSGSHYDGWAGEVARSEIADVHETVTDLLHAAEAGGGR